MMNNWREFAACRGIDPELFFCVAGRGTKLYAAQVAQAKTVCSLCPVREECLRFALARIPIGVAGGLDEYERAALRRAQGQDAHLPGERVLSRR
jgi:WhiB family redox-sensing transcriptional regulator